MAVYFLNHLPVSYTHLDVYKRQQERHVYFSRTNIWIYQIINSISGLIFKHIPQTLVVYGLLKLSVVTIFRRKVAEQLLFVCSQSQRRWLGLETEVAWLCPLDSVSGTGTSSSPLQEQALSGGTHLIAVWLWALDSVQYLPLGHHLHFKWPLLGPISSSVCLHPSFR